MRFIPDGNHMRKIAVTPTFQRRKHESSVPTGNVLRAFAKLRKADIVSLRPSVRPTAWSNSAPTEQWMKFDVYISKICRENSSFIKIGQEQPVLHMKTDIHFWSYLVQFFLEWDMFQKKTFRENQNKYFMFSNFWKPCRLRDNVEK
jgi:hypothetical protein